MNPSAGLTEVRVADPRTTVTRTSPESTPPNMEDRVTTQSTQDADVVVANAPPRNADQETQRDVLEQMIQEINREYSTRNISLKFSVDDQSGSLIIQVMDTTNDKVIRQIPPDAVLAIRRRMRALLGDIFDMEA